MPKQGQDRLKQLKAIVDSPNLAIVDALEEVKDAIESIEMPEMPQFPEIVIPEPITALTIENPGEIKDDIVASIEQVKTLISNYISYKKEKKDDKKDDKFEDLIDAIQSIQFPENIDYNAKLDIIISELKKDTTSYQKAILGALQAEKEYFPSEVLDYDRVKVSLDPRDLEKIGGGQTIVTQGGGIQGDLVHTNSHTGEKEVRVYQANHICLQNTTNTPLLANATFTGDWQDCLNYQEVNVSVDTDQNSATNGLVIQWSSDAINVADTDAFTIYANSGTNYTPNPAFRYVRIVYTNGAVNQTRFHLMTILRRGVTGGSFHRIDSTLKDDSDARLNITVPKLKTAANTYVSQQATTAGNAKVSIEEFDGAVSTDTNKLNVAPYLIDEDGIQSQMLTDTYFAGSPVVIDAEHHEIHCGDMVSLTHTVDLTNGATRDLLMIIPNPAITEKRYHFYIEITTESEADYKLYETPTTTANGTSVAGYNRNRQDPVVAENEILFFHTPTVTAVGTLIEEEHWGSGRGVGGGSRAANEWVLKNNTKYLIRVNNATVNNNYIAIKINYYVHPGV